ncbi:MAG: hypothetical protein Q8940_21955 [Bacteroidota bacterium]|nr:hypothetical protein [Bacteroidota bacterium]
MRLIQFKMKIFVLIALFFFALSSAIYANAGTALVWAGAIHLYIINLAIGIFEAFWLDKSVNQERPLLMSFVIIIANYTSMIAGVYVSIQIYKWFRLDVGDPNFSEYIWQNIILYLSFIVLSIIVEYPFYFYFIRKSQVKKAVTLVCKINLVSAAIVIGFYLLFHVVFGVIVS